MGAHTPTRSMSGAATPSSVKGGGGYRAGHQQQQLGDGATFVDHLHAMRKTGEEEMDDGSGPFDFR